MAIKALLLDFDGTSLQKDQTYITFRNMHAIRQAIAKGCEIIPCTGRAQDMLPPQIMALDAVRYLITSSGSRIVNRETGELIYQSLFTPEESVQILKIFANQKIYAEIAAEGKIFVEKEVNDHLENYKVPPHHVWFMDAGMQVAVDDIVDYFEKNQICLEKVNIYDIPKERQQSLFDELNATGIIAGMDETGIVPGMDKPGEELQFFPRRLDKILGVQTLLDKLGLDYSEVMSIGDGPMDLPVIQRSGVGVAMGNAPDWLKEKADDVTDSFDRDGVAKAIEKHIL